MIGHNHSLHAFLLSKDSVCDTARDKDGNHRVESVFPTKGQACYQHDGPIYQERNTTDILTCFLANGQADDIRPTTGDIVAKSKTNPQAHDNTPKKGIDNRILRQGCHRDELDKEGTHGHRDKGKNSKLMANLIPSQDHQRKINGVKGQRNRNVKTKPVITQGRDNLCQTCRTTRIHMTWLEKEIDRYC